MSVPTNDCCSVAVSMQPPSGETRPAATTETAAGAGLESSGARHHLARYAWAAGSVRGRRVLDAACGRGDGVRLLAAGGAASVSGAGAQAENITAALEAAGDVADFAVAPVHELPFDDGAFDIVVCLAPLESIRVTESIAELRRVLSADGTLILALSGDDSDGAADGIAVRAAFDHVTVVRQTSWSASAVLAETAPPGTALDSDVRIAAGAAPDALQALAIACASAAPELPPPLVTLGAAPTAISTAEYSLAPLRQVQVLGALNMRLEAELAEAHEALQRAEAAHAEELAALTAQAQEQIGQADRAQALEELARAEADALQARLAAAENANAQQIVEHALGAQRAIEEIERSLSWRITKPLRAVKRIARRGRSS